MWICLIFKVMTDVTNFCKLAFICTFVYTLLGNLTSWLELNEFCTVYCISKKLTAKKYFDMNHLKVNQPA